MSDEAQPAAVAALIGLAGSADARDGADAGRSLASSAEMPEAGRTLLGLVLDAGDTSVTRMTAEALLRRQDTAGSRWSPRRSLRPTRAMLIGLTPRGPGHSVAAPVWYADEPVKLIDPTPAPDGQPPVDLADRVHQPQRLPLQLRGVRRRNLLRGRRGALVMHRRPSLLRLRHERADLLEVAAFTAVDQPDEPHRTASRVAIHPNRRLHVPARHSQMVDDDCHNDRTIPFPSHG
jgi:hypothetical protein